MKLISIGLILLSFSAQASKNCFEGTKIEGMSFKTKCDFKTVTFSSLEITHEDKKYSLSGFSNRNTNAANFCKLQNLSLVEISTDNAFFFMKELVDLNADGSFHYLGQSTDYIKTIICEER